MERLLRKTLANGCFDNVTPERSRVMSKIRGKHNKSTELSLKMGLVRAGVRGFLLHPSTLPGRPDFYFPKERLAIFVDGCFWHGCKQCGHVPKTNSKFWALKIQRNIERDAKNLRLLRKQGVKVLRIWEHQLGQDVGACVRLIQRRIA
jgi:DNA mismatch endonuclease Vsr